MHNIDLCFNFSASTLIFLNSACIILIFLSETMGWDGFDTSGEGEEIDIRIEETRIGANKLT